MTAFRRVGSRSFLSKHHNFAKEYIRSYLDRKLGKALLLKYNRTIIHAIVGQTFTTWVVSGLSF